MTVYDTVTRVRLNSGGSDVGTQRRLNFIEGTYIDLTVVEDAVDGEIDIQISSSGGVLAHDLGGASHNADTLANLNAKISDATLVDMAGLTASIAELNLLDLSGLTAGQLLVATGASSAGWQSTGIVLTSPTINGTIATTGLTMPAFTLGGTITLNGQAFDAGSGDAQINTTGLGEGLKIISIQDGVSGAFLRLTHVTTAAAVDDVVSRIYGIGCDDADAEEGYGFWDIRVEDPTAAHPDGKQLWFCRSAGGWNEAMTLSSAGGLSVDADIGTGDDPVALFDTIPAKYGMDDAQFLVQSVVNKETLPKFCEIGVMSRKDTGSGYMLNYQKAQYFTWGAIKALYERMEELESKLVERRN